MKKKINPLIFKIAKITAENDSIYEGYNYCDEYLEKSIYSKNDDSATEHYEQAIKIYALFQSELQKILDEMPKKNKIHCARCKEICDRDRMWNEAIDDITKLINERMKT